MHTLITFQACQIAANFTTDWALSITLVHTNVTMRNNWLDMFGQMAFKTSKWEFFTYFTVDMLILWTWYWSFVSDILNMAVPKGFYTHVNQLAPLTSPPCHFPHWSTDMLNCLRQIFTDPRSVLWFWCLSLPFTHFTVKQLFWPTTVIHSNDMTSPTKRTHYHQFSAW